VENLLIELTNEIIAKPLAVFTFSMVSKISGIIVKASD
jgi:hypothetical protein